MHVLHFVPLYYNTSIVFLPPAEVTKKSTNIKDAEKANIHVVDEDFLDSVQKGGACLMIQKHKIVSM